MLKIGSTKDLVVTGASRLIGDVAANKIQTTVMVAPTTAGGTVYGPGSNGQILVSNGSSVYWSNGGLSSGSAGYAASAAQATHAASANYSASAAQATHAASSQYAINAASAGYAASAAQATHAASANYALSAASAGYAASAANATYAASAGKLGSSNVGNYLNPIYLNSGTATASKGNIIPFITGTGTTAGTWLGTLDGLTAYTDGLLILYKSPVAGASTTTLNLNNLGAKTVYINNTTKLTTHFPVNQPILLVYSTSQNSGCWMCLDDYWTNSNTIPAAYCVTAAATAAKAASCDYWVATANSYLHFDIRYANSVAGAITMNVNSTGAKPIYINGTASSASNNTLPAGSYIAFYDGTNFQFRTDGYLPGLGIIGKSSSAGYAASAARATYAASANYAASAAYANDATKLPLAGGTMTGTINLASTGLKTNSNTGYSTDSAGNFKHYRATTSDYWHLDNNAGTAAFSLYWETGDATITGQSKAVSYKVNDVVTMQYNSTTDSLDFIFS